MEELTRALTCGDESRVDSAKERAALLQQLHGAEQVVSGNIQPRLLDLSEWTTACHATYGPLMRQPQLPIMADVVQVRYEAERAREQAQKQLAAAEGRAGVLHTRLDDVLADNRALKHKVCMLMTGPEGCCLQPDEQSLCRLHRCDTLCCTLARLWAAPVGPERHGKMQGALASWLSARAAPSSRQAP